MLNFSFNQEQESFQAMLRDFSLHELLPQYTKWDREHKHPRHLWKRLGELGVNGLRVPEEYGGSGADCVIAGIAAEEIGRGDFNLTYAVMLNALVSEIIANHATGRLKKTWLPQIASGDKIVGIAITEPAAGSDVAGIRSTAIHKGNHYLLNGEKSGISAATIADAFIVFAKTDPDSGSRGISAFIVPADLPGVECKGYEDMGNVPIGRGSIYLNDVEVPEENIIGLENKGFTQVMNGFDLSRLLIGLQCIGAAFQSIDETIEHVKTRHAFGRPLAKFQGVSFPIVTHFTQLELIKWQAYRGLWLRDQEKKHTKEAASVKWLGPKLSQEAIHECMLLNGHYAYTKEMPIEQRLRDVIGLEIGDGTAQVNQMVIARELIGKDFRSY
ncbi:cyclohexanecarboxyl-CoA dehydrogenase [Peribacillus cavernae]|uniref:Cyclohexanecarboxyl-CoA dehydrogenase n=1 Tax=Peribacillus cavernae TaxID=1674310 RepID=A0A433HFR4_9BACI|nr:acyl-CoA dehydrogenase family protein [Peribacillus cavernae]MDQ0219438.1 cyclohexanecarboxyl-CoA dehydrogenase [Peribacillus cavernae]RUQ27138.1 cyclohexanecarboxyl-CoA dehydrogenase [Peribacillus cavernae]